MRARVEAFGAMDGALLASDGCANGSTASGVRANVVSYHVARVNRLGFSRSVLRFHAIIVLIRSGEGVRLGLGAFVAVRPGVVRVEARATLAAALCTRYVVEVARFALFTGTTFYTVSRSWFALLALRVGGIRALTRRARLARICGLTIRRSVGADVTIRTVMAFAAVVSVLARLAPLGQNETSEESCDEDGGGAEEHGNDWKLLTMVYEKGLWVGDLKESDERKGRLEGR